MSLEPPDVVTRMPSLSKKFVERECRVSVRGFWSSLMLNVFLMAACAAHSLPTRKLPANFNEAKFIALCVYTFLVLWLSFLATFFFLRSSASRTICFTLLLIVNVISCQIFLFLSKLYAVCKLPAFIQNVSTVTNSERG